MCYAEKHDHTAVVSNYLDEYYHTEEWVRSDGKHRLARISLETLCRKHAAQQAEQRKKEVGR